MFFGSKTVFLGYIRPAQLAELPRSKFDPELFPYSVYVKFVVTLATKVPYLTFCKKNVTNFDGEEMEREGGNGERMRKLRGNGERSTLYISSFSPRMSQKS